MKKTLTLLSLMLILGSVSAVQAETLSHMQVSSAPRASNSNEMHSILSYTDKGEKQVQGTASKFEVAANHPESAKPKSIKQEEKKIDDPMGDSCGGFNTHGCDE